MKKILLIVTLAAWGFQAANAQTFPILGTISAGQTKNVLKLADSLKNDSTKFNISNTGLTPLKFYMASSSTAAPVANRGITVPTGQTVQASVAQLGNVATGAYMNVNNASPITSLLQGVFSVDKVIQGIIPTGGGGTTQIDPCGGLLGVGTPVWVSVPGVGPNFGLPGQTSTIGVPGYMYVCPYGNVGIGTRTPQYPLDVSGSANITGSLFASRISIGNTTYSQNLLDVHTSSTATNKITADFGQDVSGIHRRFLVTPNLGSGAYNPLTQAGDMGLFWTDGNGASGNNENLNINSNAGLVLAPWSQNSAGCAPGMRIDQNGHTVLQSCDDNNPALAISNGGGSGRGLSIRAGGTIGSNGSFYILDVANYAGYSYLRVSGVDGATYARKVIVTANTFPDFVFEKDYHLMSISELESYINANHHLPEVPSAKEIEDNNGIDLGSMNEKLLKKVEELTLYMIAQQKEIDALKAAQAKK